MLKLNLINKQIAIRSYHNFKGLVGIQKFVPKSNVSRFGDFNGGLRRFSTETVQNVQNDLKAVANAKVESKDSAKRDREYFWITAEAENLIARAYARHAQLALEKFESETAPELIQIKSFPPSLSAKDLETLQIAHYKPENVSDRVALQFVKILEGVMSMFFRTKYDHHAVTLETVAAVPGIVGAMFRHLRSLRSMKRDHGWINPLQEEAENERMHLLIWMQHTKPTKIERYFVMLAQAIYVTFYSGLYAVSSKTAHRMTGYLEEAAFKAYSEYLHAIDTGMIKNVPAMKIARKYYRLKEEATLRDVVLHVRADECMHRDYNHHLANLYKTKRQDCEPVKML